MNLIERIEFWYGKYQFKKSIANSRSPKAEAVQALRVSLRRDIEADLKFLDLVVSGDISRGQIRHGLCSCTKVVGILDIKRYTNLGYIHYSGSCVYPIRGSVTMFYRESSHECISKDFYYLRVELARHWAVQVRQLLSDMDKYL